MKFSRKPSLEQHRRQGREIRRMKTMLLALEAIAQRAYGMGSAEAHACRRAVIRVDQLVTTFQFAASAEQGDLSYVRHHPGEPTVDQLRAELEGEDQAAENQS